MNYTQHILQYLDTCVIAPDLDTCVIAPVPRHLCDSAFKEGISWEGEGEGGGEPPFHCVFFPFKKSFFSWYFLKKVFFTFCSAPGRKLSIGARS